MRWIGSVVMSLAAIVLAYAMLAAQGSRFNEAIEVMRSRTGTVRITGCLQRADQGGATPDDTASSGFMLTDAQIGSITGADENRSPTDAPANGAVTSYRLQGGFNN
jgi:hypothetical protein